MDPTQIGTPPQHQTSWVWICALIVIIAGVIGFIFWYQGYCQKSAPTTAQTANGNVTPVIGGKCAYAEYPGTCKITAVEAVSDQPAGGNDGAQIKFTFTLSKGEVVTQTGVDLTPGKIYEKMAAQNGSGDKVGWTACRDEFQIRANKTYDCTLQVETAGTCTPQIFKFKDIDDKCLMY